MSEATTVDPGRGTRLESAWTLAQTALGFVGWLSREFAHTGVSREDLESEGRLGLVDAALRFDPSHGVQFVTYASWWARRRMQTLVVRQSRAVRRPELRGEPHAAAPRDISLDAPLIRGEARTWGDLLPDGKPAPLEIALRNENVALVTSATDELPAQWREVVVERFGLDGAPPRTLAAIGGRLGVSRERVRQIETKAMRRLRERVARAWGRH